MSNGGSLDEVSVLDAATVQEMWTPQIPETEPTQGVFWYTEDVVGRTVMGHNGSMYGTATQFGVDLDSGVGAVVLANVDWTFTQLQLWNIYVRLFEAGEAL